MPADIDIFRLQTRKVDMLSRAQIAHGNETYRFSTTHTLSDFPPLIGEMLRRSDLRSDGRARWRARIRKIKGMLAVANRYA